MKILVTGATGFIGSHVVRMLLEAGHTIRILRRQQSPTRLIEDLLTTGLATGDATGGGPPPPRSEASSAGGYESGRTRCKIEPVIGDVTEAQSVDRAVAGCEAVMHLAGLVSFWSGDRQRLHEVNVLGTRNVVAACLTHKVRRLVHTSSVAGVGFALDGRLGDEKLPYNWGPCRIPYCDTKHEAEIEVQKGVSRGLDAVILNPAVVFGPGDLNLHGGAMVLQMARRKIGFWFDGGCSVSDVGDVAAAHLAALQQGNSGNRYILGGDNFSWKDLFGLIAEVVGAPPPSRRIPTSVLAAMGRLYALHSRLTKKRPPLTPEAVRISSVSAFFSSEKAARELGYTTSPFRETVRRTYQWYRDNDYLRGGS